MTQPTWGLGFEHQMDCPASCNETRIVGVSKLVNAANLVAEGSIIINRIPLHCIVYLYLMWGCKS